MPRKLQSLQSVAVAALSVDLTAGVSAAAPTEFRLIPAGAFRAKDGRPAECASWVMLDEDGARLVAAASARQSDFVLDYEHATLQAKKAGTKAPAAAWFKQLEWRSGDGLWAVGVNWTAAAAQLVEAQEYRYISPVFSYDQQTGRVGDLFFAALTNDPALLGLTDLAALSALAGDIFSPTPSEENTMDEALLEQLRWLLNLPVGATADDVKAQLQKLISQLGAGTAVAAASFDLPAYLKAQTEQIAALSAKLATTPAPADPAAFVPMAQFIGLQNELAALSGKMQSTEHAKLFQEGLDDGRILPAVADYWRSQPLAVLSGYLAVAKPMAALGGTQTGGLPPAGGALGVAALSAEQQAVCSQLGLSADEYRKSLTAESA